jgi:hypothetical protein
MDDALAHSTLAPLGTDLLAVLLGYVADEDALQWASTNGCPWDPSTCMDAAEDEGHMHVLRWLRTSGQLD